MNKAVKCNSITKSELYKLYLRGLRKIERLEAKIYAQQEEIAKQAAELEKKNFQLVQRNKIIFGKKREKNPLADTNVANEAETIIASSKKEVTKKNDKKSFTKEYLEEHHTDELVLTPEEIETIPDLIHFGDDITYKIEYTPAKRKIIKIINKKYIDKKSGKIYQRIKEDPFPNSYCTPSFASESINNKFVLGIPYYRQENYLVEDGISISRQNLSNYQLKASEIVKPMYELLKEKLLETSFHIIHADETTLRVINVPKAKCYIWLFNSCFYDKPIFIYLFNKTRSADVPKEFLKNYQGYLISDCYSGYNEIPDVINSYCWAHARRKFIEIIDNLTDELKKESISVKIVNEIDNMFYLDKKYREEQYTASEIKEMRNSGEFKKSLDKVLDLLHSADPEPKSPFEAAVEYITKREDSFLEILNDGHLELSNNSAERGIKPFVMARKNFLFSLSEEGADSSMILFSILQTAIANARDPKQYLEYLLKHIKKNTTKEELEYLLPWNIQF